MSINEVAVEKLRRKCQDAELAFCTTSADVPPLDDFIGQQRAVSAMQFGLSMKAQGYNIFVVGPPGTGKTTYTQTVVCQTAFKQETPSDWCLLHNFNNADEPLAISIPPGTAIQFQKDMNELINEIRTSVPKLLQSKEYESRKKLLMDGIQHQLDSFVAQLKEDAAKSGFVLKSSQEGIFFIPEKDGQPLDQESYLALPEERRQVYEDNMKVLQKRTEELIQSGKSLEKETDNVIKKLEQDSVLEIVIPLVQKVKDKYAFESKIVTHLDKMIEDYIINLDCIFGKEPSSSDNNCDDWYVKYKVNVFVNNADTQGAPVVVETNPHYYNLFGKVEYRGKMGTVNTDFSMVKPGSIHKANGGYLIVQAKDLLADPHSWGALKKALKNRQVTMENIGENYRSVPTISLKPEHIPLNVKVIIVGIAHLYRLLQRVDEDFEKLFKVMVDFEIVMPRTSENLKNYAVFVGSVCKKEGLPHFDKSGLGEIIEHGSRLAGNQNKLSTQFNEVVEVILEAASWARIAGADLVSSEHVRKAINEKIYRYRRVEERLQELILRGVILVDTEGLVVGQVNGLAVLNTGNYAFGKPSRITAKTYMGQEGLVNIERETEMSGSIHSKGVLTLTGFLGHMFAQEKPLALSAQITFEQLYEGVEGDSASSAELYALLSSLSGVPIRQSLAVTGSVNQKGDIQAIGGVTEKIEGFFGICKARGLTGEQGVIIPVQNVDNLMLNHEVVEAVKQGMFHIYAISKVEEGIELLTGMSAGEKQENGLYPQGTIFHLVDQKLHKFAQGLKDFSM